MLRHSLKSQDQILRTYNLPAPVFDWAAKHNRVEQESRLTDDITAAADMQAKLNADQSEAIIKSPRPFSLIQRPPIFIYKDQEERKKHFDKKPSVIIIVPKEKQSSVLRREINK